MPIIKVVPTIPEMRKHTGAASVYVQILRGVEHWILEGATYRHDPQKKTVYFMRRTFSAEIKYSGWPPFATASLLKILNTYDLI